MAPKGIVIQITGDGASAARALELVDTHLRETAATSKESAAGIHEAMELIKTSLETIGAGVAFEAISEAVAKIKEMIGASIELGMELGHASKETGISAENLSVLKYASDVTGVSFEALTKGLGRMSKAMLEAEEGKKAAVQTFNRLGISQQQVSEHSNDMLGMLGMVADRFQTLPDGPQKSAVAIGLFGKAGMALIPFLDEGSEGISKLKGEAQALGLVLDDQGIAKLESMHHSLTELQGGLEGAGLGISVGLEPALRAAADAMVVLTGRTDAWVAIGEMAGKMAIYFGEGLLEIAKYAELAIQGVIGVDAEISVLEAHGMSMIAITKAQKAAAAASLAEARKMVDDAETNAVKAVFAVDKAEAALARYLHPSSAPERKPGGSGLNLQDQSEGKGKGTNGVAAAAAALAEANATAEAAAQKSADDLLLVQMDADHKLFLTSDANYYREKLVVQKDGLDAEENGLRQRIAELQALEAKQHGDKKLTRDKGGNSAEEEKTATEIVKLNQQINALEEKRAALNVNAGLEAQQRADAVNLANLRAAATIEEQVNGGITARLALMQREQQIAMQKTTAEGGDVHTLAVLQQQEQALLRIQDIERQIHESEEDNRRATGEISDHAAKDPRFKLEAAKQINQLNADEAAQLKVLVAQYDALAATLGGPFLQNAKNLHAEMDKLNTPNKKGDAEFTKTLGDGITHMAEQIGSASVSGKNAFHNMVQSMEKDVIELAIKLAAQKWLMPFLNSLGKGAGGGGGDNTEALQGLSDMGMPGFASGGDFAGGPMMVGEDGPELMFPKGPGTVIPNDALQNLSRSGGSGVPNVTMNITNASSQPVTARQTGTSFDSDMKAFVIHTILEDHASGGPISAAAGGNS